MPTYNNLVPLHVDKETGKMVASHRGGFALGGAKGYVHEQAVAETVWTIDHHVGTIMMIPQIFDADHNEIIPDNLQVVDINTLELTFGQPQDGFVHIIFFKVG